MVTVSLRCRRRGTVGFCGRAGASPSLWSVLVFPACQGHHRSIRPCDAPTRGRHGELARGVASPSPVPQTPFYSRCLWFFPLTGWPAPGAQPEGACEPFWAGQLGAVPRGSRAQGGHRERLGTTDQPQQKRWQQATAVIGRAYCFPLYFHVGG